MLAAETSLAVGGLAGAVAVTPPEGLVVCVSGDWIGRECARMARPMSKASAIGTRNPITVIGSKCFLLANGWTGCMIYSISALGVRRNFRGLALGGGWLFAARQEPQPSSGYGATLPTRGAVIEEVLALVLVVCDHQSA